MAHDTPTRQEVIEVTPEMLSAGVQAACLFSPSQDSFEVMLPTIFRAMLTAYSPSRESPE